MKGQRGFGAILAIIVLVMLTALSVAIVRLGTVQQTSSAQDILSARAWQAAKSGTEWGLYQALKSASCNTTQTLDLVADTGFKVTVSCNSSAYNEGESTPGTQQVRHVFRIEAVACNSENACPDDARAVSPGYIERKRQIIATD